jgi:hypothetical protein
LGGGIPGIGPGGTPFFNGGGGLGSNFPTGSIGILPNGEPAFNVSGGRKGILSQIFGKGGIFGSEGFGNNVGTFGAIGAGGNLLGGLIGGQAGGIISGTFSGLAIGAQIGSIVPGIGTAIGAGIGALVGFFASLFGGDPKKKRDKNEKIPQLAQGFNDALKDLQDILAGVRSLSIDPDEAISRAADIRSQIASGFGIQFESSKYRKQAQQQIQAKLRDADAIIAQIGEAAGIARGAADRRETNFARVRGRQLFRRLSSGRTGWCRGCSTVATTSSR